MKHAIKDTETGLYYQRGTYNWTYDLEDARIYPNEGSANKALRFAKGDVWEHKEMNHENFSVRPYEPSSSRNVEVVELKEKTVLVEA